MGDFVPTPSRHGPRKLHVEYYICTYMWLGLGSPSTLFFSETCEIPLPRHDDGTPPRVCEARTAAVATCSLVTLTDPKFLAQVYLGRVSVCKGKERARRTDCCY